jgi:hypothetical protein
LARAPDILRDQNTGLKEIAEFLLTPVHSGVFLSRDDLGSLARQLGLPRGFGNRQQIMLNLTRSAVQFNQLPDLLIAVGLRIAIWEDKYATYSNQYPEISLFIAPWEERARHTARLLREIRAQVDLSVWKRAETAL